MAETAKRRAVGAADVEAVADLARIALGAGEAERLARDLDRILAAAESLGRADLDDAAGVYRPSAEGPDQGWWSLALAEAVEGRRPALGTGPGDLSARLRPDTPAAGLAREAALSQAPARDEAFFVVPTVVERT